MWHLYTHPQISYTSFSKIYIARTVLISPTQWCIRSLFRRDLIIIRLLISCQDKESPMDLNIAKCKMTFEYDVGY